MNKTIVLYTHTDMADVWVPFFGQFQKYMLGDYKFYTFINKEDNRIPENYTQIIYDDSLTYTERLKMCLPMVDEEILLFIHEDMILYSEPKHDLLDKYFNYISNNLAESIKLIYTGNSDKDYMPSQFDETLVVNSFAKFQIQPTIVRKSILEQLVDGVGPKTIWEFEEAIVGAGMDYMVKLGGEPRRGIYHYDSFVFPYVATAINKGKWNLIEYQKELNPIFEEYSINPFERGMS